MDSDLSYNVLLAAFISRLDHAGYMSHSDASAAAICLHAPSSDATVLTRLPLATEVACKQEEEPDVFIVASPYTSRAHLLGLRTVSKPNQLLAKALTVLEPIRSDYATASYTAAFNWTLVFETLARVLDEDNSYHWEPQIFYVIVFRSQIPPTTDRLHLGAFDEVSHAEATKSGGLLKYWFGVPDANGRNLATCIWRARGDARRGGAGAGHAHAVRETTKLYTEWKVERLKLIISEGARHWTFTKWED